MMRRVLAMGAGIGLLGTLAAPAALAQSLDINLSDESARILYATRMATGQHGHSEVEVGFMYNEDRNAALTAGLHVFNRSLAGPSPASLGLGGRIYGVTHDDPSADGIALALGGQGRWAPAELGGFGLGAHFYYAPRIVSFLDADRITEYGVRLDYQLMPQAFVYLGHRDIRMKLENGATRTVDRGAHLGFRVLF